MHEVVFLRIWATLTLHIGESAVQLYACLTRHLLVGARLAMKQSIGKNPLWLDIRPANLARSLLSSVYSPT